MTDSKNNSKAVPAAVNPNPADEAEGLAPLVQGPIASTTTPAAAAPPAAAPVSTPAAAPAAAKTGATQTPRRIIVEEEDENSADDAEPEEEKAVEAEAQETTAPATQEASAAATPDPAVRITLHQVTAIGNGSCLFNSFSLILACKFLQSQAFRDEFAKNPWAIELTNLLVASKDIQLQRQPNDTPATLFQRFLDEGCKDWYDLQNKLAPCLRLTEEAYFGNALRNKQVLFSEEYNTVIYQRQNPNSKKEGETEDKKGSPFFAQQFMTDFDSVFSAFVKYSNYLRSEPGPNDVFRYDAELDQGQHEFLLNYELVYDPTARLNRPIFTFRDHTTLNLKELYDYTQYYLDDETGLKAFQKDGTCVLGNTIIDLKNPTSTKDMFVVQYLKIEHKRLQAIALSEQLQEDGLLEKKDQREYERRFAPGKPLSGYSSAYHKLRGEKPEDFDLANFIDFSFEDDEPLITFEKVVKDGQETTQAKGFFGRYFDMHFHTAAFGNVRDGKILSNILKIPSVFRDAPRTETAAIMTKYNYLVGPENADRLKEVESNYLRVIGKKDEFMQIERKGEHFDIAVTPVYLGLTVGTQKQPLRLSKQGVSGPIPYVVASGANDQEFDGTLVLPKDCQPPAPVVPVNPVPPNPGVTNANPGEPSPANPGATPGNTQNTNPPQTTPTGTPASDAPKSQPQSTESTDTEADDDDEDEDDTRPWLSNIRKFAGAQLVIGIAAGLTALGLFVALNFFAVGIPMVAIIATAAVAGVFLLTSTVMFGTSQYAISGVRKEESEEYYGVEENGIWDDLKEYFFEEGSGLWPRLKAKFKRGDKAATASTAETKDAAASKTTAADVKPKHRKTLWNPLNWFKKKPKEPKAVVQPQATPPTKTENAPLPPAAPTVTPKFDAEANAPKAAPAATTADQPKPENKPTVDSKPAP